MSTSTHPEFDENVIEVYVHTVAEATCVHMLLHESAESAETSSSQSGHRTSRHDAPSSRTPSAWPMAAARPHDWPLDGQF
ncbi:hypothetical protein [Candidatus Poriferisodalis sp.]|uniref:hypothetical protein n=1 Tax=Candidatus Poriferisodalis sp. TaxID=3101277 RepID=UPI003B02AF57